MGHFEGDHFIVKPPHNPRFRDQTRSQRVEFKMIEDDCSLKVVHGRFLSSPRKGLSSSSLTLSVVS